MRCSPSEKRDAPQCDGFPYRPGWRAGGTGAKALIASVYFGCFGPQAPRSPRKPSAARPGRGPWPGGSARPRGGNGASARTRSATLQAQATKASSQRDETAPSKACVPARCTEGATLIESGHLCQRASRPSMADARYDHIPSAGDAPALSNRLRALAVRAEPAPRVRQLHFLGPVASLGRDRPFGLVALPSHVPYAPASRARAVGTLAGERELRLAPRHGRDLVRALLVGFVRLEGIARRLLGREALQLRFSGQGQGLRAHRLLHLLALFGTHRRHRGPHLFLHLRERPLHVDLDLP